MSESCTLLPLLPVFTPVLSILRCCGDTAEEHCGIHEGHFAQLPSSVNETTVTA